MTRHLKLLTVGYSYINPNGHQRHDSHGQFHIFGLFGTPSTNRYLRWLFQQRHGNAKLIEFTLINSQP